MSELAGLLERVKAATGPNEKLDGDIFAVLGGDRWKAARLRASGSCGAPEDVIDRDARMYAPRYTASIDAALALVEAKLPGWGWDVGIPANLGKPGTGGQPWASCWPQGYGNERVNYHNNAPTAPLAILAALLSALQQGEGK